MTAACVHLSAVELKQKCSGLLLTCYISDQFQQGKVLQQHVSNQHMIKYIKISKYPCQIYLHSFKALGPIGNNWHKDVKRHETSKINGSLGVKLLQNARILSRSRKHGCASHSSTKRLQKWKATRGTTVCIDVVQNCFGLLSGI